MIKDKFSIEIIGGIVILLVVAIWAYFYIKKRTKANNNEHLFELIPHIFPSLGILFTFIGISIGFFNFDEHNVIKSIPDLLHGLKTAFSVSILGVLFLVIFSIWTSIKRKKLEEGVVSDEVIAIRELTKELKNSFVRNENVIGQQHTEIKKMQSLQLEENRNTTKKINDLNTLLNNVLLTIENSKKEYFTELSNSLIFIDENGNKVPVVNVLRDLYFESIKQSSALQSFSTDLSIKIEAGFETIMSNQIQNGVIPELQQLKNSVDNLGSNLKDPASEMTQNVVNDLQDAMKNMIGDFKNSVSGSAKDELEALTKILGQAGNTLMDFPSKIDSMSEKMSLNFQSISSVLTDVTEQSKNQSIESTNSMKEQIEDISRILKNEIGEMQNGQKSLMTKQTENISLSENMVATFNTTIDRMNSLLKEINGSVGQYSLIQQEMKSTTHQFKLSSDSVQIATSKLSESQTQFNQFATNFLDKNNKTIEEIQKTLKQAIETSEEFTENYNEIDEGLNGIFEEINNGVILYQKTMKDTMENYLSIYSDKLTQATGSLTNASNIQQEFLEELTEEISKLNLRK